jgi:hypothetical protein
MRKNLTNMDIAYFPTVHLSEQFASPRDPVHELVLFDPRHLV